MDPPKSDRTNGLAFDGDTIEFLGWLLLTILSALLIVPLAWTYAAICRWFCRNLRFPDRTTVTFTGTGPQILGWMILGVVLSAATSIPHTIDPHFLLLIPAAIAGFFLGPLVHLMILRWLVRNLRLSSGPSLEFDGSYAGYLGYQVLIGISVLTIVGWAWALASFYRWIAEHTRGEGIAVGWNSDGWEVLGYTLAAILGSIPIVTIPWVWMWYIRWFTGCGTLTRGAGGSDSQAGMPVPL